MRPFLKTLFGDASNVAVVAGLLTIQVVLVHTGYGHEATILFPLLTLGGAALLAVGWRGG